MKQGFQQNQYLVFFILMMNIYVCNSHFQFLSDLSAIDSIWLTCTWFFYEETYFLVKFKVALNKLVPD